ncbi:hypothetical protein IMCC13023_12160 [Candidatus Aquiluna sp. IMCC13023]|nr:hypothetical protein IMCC13023_12160 [Candidatus Aquiluna sp. IMCC13023]
MSRTNVLKAVGAFSFVFLALGLTASGSIPALFFELVLGLEVFANLAPVGVNLFLNLDLRFSQGVKRHAVYQIVHQTIC